MLTKRIFDLVVKGQRIYQAEWIVYEELKQNKKVDNEVLKIMFKEFGKKKLFSKVDALFEKIKENHKLDLKTYNAILNSYAKETETSGKNPEKVEALMEEIIKKGILPDIATYNIYVKHLLNQDKLQEAQTFVSDISTTVKLDLQIYNSFLDYYAKKGDTEMIRNMIKELKKDNYEPDIVSYTCLMKSLEVNEDWKGIEELFQFLLDNYYYIDIYFFNRYLRILESIGAGSSIVLFDTLKELKLTPKKETYELLLSIAIQSKRMNRVNYILNYMTLGSISVPVYLVPKLTNMLCINGESERAWNLIKTFPKVNQEALQIIYNDFLKIGKLDVANQVELFAKDKGISIEKP